MAALGIRPWELPVVTPPSVAVLVGLGCGGPVPRQANPAEGIDHLQACDVAGASQLGGGVKLGAMSVEDDPVGQVVGCGLAAGAGLNVW